MLVKGGRLSPARQNRHRASVEFDGSATKSVQVPIATQGDLTMINGFRDRHMDRKWK
jgi:hypothetical protein